MATEPPVTTSGGMIDRIKGILLKPQDEWAKIAAEPMTIGGILTTWVAPLAAIGPIAGLIGMFAFGYSVLGIPVTPPVAFIVSTAIAGWVMAIVGAVVFGFILSALAPSFGGQKDDVAGVKIAAFGSTATYLVGIVQLVPGPLGVLGILGLYSLYVIYVGLPILMKTPQDKVLVYFIVAIVVAVVIYFVIGIATAAVSGMFMPRAPLVMPYR